MSWQSFSSLNVLELAVQERNHLPTDVQWILRLLSNFVSSMKPMVEILRLPFNTMRTSSFSQPWR
ncbi:hypothetical protein CJF30_00002736 [Rutstroemia sp. NJR-2017a BBW]|nr:hypothetical protein CJF30_00002736 [Rutstroemia sp. NJR-2017a BBW]